MKKLLIVIIAIVVIVGLFVIGSYNSLVTVNVSADTQWKQVESLYQRRFDLIPNVVETVKGVMKQEQQVFGTLAEARSRYSGATNANEKALAASQVESALSRLLVVVENYPELKSSGTAQSLITELEGTENRISVERMRYNEAVQLYNLKVMRFPSSIIALLFGFDKREYFNITPGTEQAPRVQL